MNPAITTVLSIIALGTLYVLLPVVAGTYRRFAKRRVVTCPETKSFAEIQIDAAHAAVSSAIGEPRLKVESCTRWPERTGCGEDCLKDL